MDASYKRRSLTASQVWTGAAQVMKWPLTEMRKIYE